MNKQTKWLVGLVAVLVAVNLVLVATIWLKKEKAARPPRGDARNFLVESLQLTDAQTKAFDSLRHEHFERMDQLRQQQLFVKDRLFGLLQEKDTNRIRQQIETYLKQKTGELQEAIDLETFNHFRSLRGLLTESQQQKFDSTIQQVLRTMGPRGGDRPPPPREGFDKHRPKGPPPPGEEPGGMPPPPHGDPE